MNKHLTAAAKPGLRWRWPGWPAVVPPLATVAVVGVLLVLGLANIAIRATWHEADDGVLWVSRLEGVTAFDVAPGTPAARAGIRPGDLLEAIDGQFVERPSDVVELLQRRKEGQPVNYRVLRLGTAEAFDFRLASLPARQHQPLLLPRAGRALHAAGRGGGAAAAAEPPGDAALPLAVGRVLRLGGRSRSAGASTASTGCSTGPTRWRCCCCRRCSCTSRCSSPSGRGPGCSTPLGSRFWPAVYLPALLLGAARVLAIARAAHNEEFFINGVVQTLDRFEPLYLSVYMAGALVVIARAFRQVRTVTARRQLRWIAWGTALGGLPFAFGYALPYALGVAAVAADGAVGDPAQPDPADLRERHRALPAGGRRGHRQAGDGVGGGAHGDRRDLRGPAARGRLDLPRGLAPAQLGDRDAGDADRRAAGAAAEERDPGDVRPGVLPRPLRLPPRARRLRPRPQLGPRPLPPERAHRHAGHRDAAGGPDGAAAVGGADRRSSRRSGRRALPGEPARLRARRRRSARGSRRASPWRSTTRRPSTGSRPRNWSRGASASCTTSSRACRRSRRSR